MGDCVINILMVTMQVSVKSKGRDFELTIQCSSVSIVVVLSSKDSAAKWLETISPRVDDDVFFDDGIHHSARVL